MSTKKTINLSELITAIRDELEEVEAARSVASREPIFGLETMDVAIKFVVSQDSKIKGGFDLKIVSLGSQLGERSENIQEVKLTYKVLPEAVGELGTRAYTSERPGKLAKGTRPV